MSGEVEIHVGNKPACCPLIAARSGEHLIAHGLRKKASASRQGRGKRCREESKPRSAGICFRKEKYSRKRGNSIIEIERTGSCWGKVWEGFIFQAFF